MNAIEYAAECKARLADAEADVARAETAFRAKPPTADSEEWEVLLEAEDWRKRAEDDWHYALGGVLDSHLLPLWRWADLRGYGF